ncbi:MAG: LysE family translocator [Deltaproteobacteria bacterium]|nr:LysE family translocator [Deltaproteobacteria bacterium]
MIPAATLAAVALASLILAATPGPAVLYIVARSVHQGRRAGALSALGVALGGMLHVTGAVVGFSALLVSSATAFAAVRWAGALYLVWIGVKTLRSGGDGAAVAVPPPAPPRQLVAQGFVVNALNPKTALFFLAFLPQFVDPARGSVAGQMLVFGITFLAVATSSDLTYAMMAGTIARKLPRTPGSRRTARWLSGGAYIALGAGAALAGQRHQ